MDDNSRENRKIIFKLKYLSKKEFIDILRRVTEGLKIILGAGNRKYTLTAYNYRRIINAVEGVETKEQTGSDKDFATEFNISDTIYFHKARESRADRKSGGFFPYISSHSFDLSRQQIFRSKKDLNEKTKDNCLIHALKASGLDEKIINKIKIMCQTRIIPQHKIKMLCEKNNIRISVKHANNKTKYYGDKKFKTIKIGLLSQHYFLIEKIPVTEYAFRHDLEDRTIADAKGKKRKGRHIDTYTAVKILLENKDKYLRSFTITKEFLKTPWYDSKFDNFEVLPEVSKDDCKKIENQNKENKNQRSVLYFDFETTTDGDVHKPFLCHYYDPSKPFNTYGFVGDDCALQMLKSLDKGDYILYAHNAGYDYRFLLKYITIKSYLNPRNNFMRCKGFFMNKDTKKKVEIEIRDSYKIISKPLRAFGKCFKLEQAKEVMPYSLQTEKNILSRFIPTYECLKAQELQNAEDREIFLSNCTKWDCIKNNEVDIVKYASVYCRIDCEVLAKGMLKFRDWIMKATGLDIYDILTIPSLAHKYMIKMNCYEGVYEISSVARSFIQKCLVGGRVMLANNKKIIREGKIADFDGVSLYPSAMERLGKIGGFLKGKPKVWNPTVDLEKVDGYFIQIEITKLNKRQRFPLASKIDNGVRTFTNNLVGQKIYIDKIALEDLVKFQEVEYKVIKGYYFNEGRNPQILETIRFLFNERLRKKKERNPIQEVYKLIMNAVYGKTLMKPVEKEDVIINGKDKMRKYVNFNFSMISEFEKIYQTDKYLIKKIKAVDNHFNICHVGIEILSMSKRIMNEVMCLAEDRNIEIMYQDTDSLHVFGKDIKPLAEAYKNTYNRDLIGKALGQFHNDFDLEGCSDVYSSKFIGLGKKCYIDHLHGTNAENKEEHSGYHIRMKGVPNSTILYEVKRANSSLIELFTDLYNGKKINFDLLEGGQRVRFKKYKNLSIGSIKEFSREISFS